MDDQRRSRPDEPERDNEGVRLIGADEAAEAIERGDIAARRTDDELRYGDRPPAPPEGPRPTLRFPLDAATDPSRIERPPVQPAPEPVTGPISLPHWTDPPTGEVPAVLISDDGPLIEESEEDLQAWSTFATSAPRWRDADDDWGDDGFVERLAGDSGEVRVGALGDPDAEPSHEEYFGFEDLDERVTERTGDQDAQPRWEAPDDDWSAADEADQVPTADADDAGDADGWDEDGWDDGADGYDDGAAGYDDADDGYAASQGNSAPDRNMGQAALVGAGLVAGLLVSVKIGDAITALLVTAILGACAAEYFAAIRKIDWETATFLGVAACVATPLAIYWRGPSAALLVGALTVMATLTWFVVGAGGPEPRVLEGSGTTLFGFLWIGLLGSHAVGLLKLSDGASLLVVVVLATAANDIAALFGGKAIGHRPLSAMSPNKTVEGVLCGMAAALFMTLVLVGALDMGPWDGAGAALLLGLTVAVAGPLGDLCQSALKRDLGIKDMGSILPGHGGVLDRFDGMLFTLPAAFWLVVTVGHVGIVV